MNKSNPQPNHSSVIQTNNHYIARTPSRVDMFALQVFIVDITKADVLLLDHHASLVDRGSFNPTCMC